MRDTRDSLRPVLFKMMSYILRYKFFGLNDRDGATGILRRVAIVAATLVPLLLAVPQSAVLADPLLTYPLQIGEQHARVEIANTAETRRKGLMFRTRLAASSGMIFIFVNERPVSMWMKNTHIPLSVAFIDANGRIVNIEHMQPETEETHSSNGPVKYALEMNLGWFDRHGITSGSRVSGLERLPPAQ